jgi:hypothetical protein
MQQVQIIEVTEEHKVYYALERTETLSNAILELSDAQHTRVPVNSRRTRSSVDATYSVPIDSELLTEDYRDMVN